MNMHANSVAAAFGYQLFGLQIRSQLELPELPVSPASDEPDVTIRIGQVPPALTSGHGGAQAIDGGLLLTISKVGRFFIKGGVEIIIEPDPGVSEGDVRLFLLGSAMGAVLHQRGLLPLHANAVEIDGMAVAFMGESGAGKSTLAAWFHDQGHRIIADDVCVVRFDEGGRAHASPGLPRLRLWKEALEASGRETALHNLSYAGGQNVEKYDVPIPNAEEPSNETALAAVYLLAKGSDLTITRSNGLKAAEAILANTYRGDYIPITKNMREYWESCVALVRSTPVFIVSRLWSLEELHEQGTQMLDHARQQVAIRRKEAAGP